VNGNKVLDISWETILKIAATAICFYVLFLIKDILIWFIFALIISILFNPAIDFLEKRKIPRLVGVVLIYLFFFGILIFFLYSTAILFLEEIQQFSQFLPQYLGRISPILQSFGLPIFGGTEDFIQTISGDLEKTTRSIISVFSSFFGGIFSSIFIITMAIFISLEQKPIERMLSLFFPKNYEVYALNLWTRCQKKVSGWFLTRIIACLFVGGVSYIALLLFQTKYPLSLGLMAGVLNFIPVVGPIIAGALMFLIAFFDSLLKAIFVLIAFILIQQVENNILTPLLSKKFIGISPVLVLISLAVGGELWGLLGAVLAVPLAGILFEFLKEFLQKRKERKIEVL